VTTDHTQYESNVNDFFSHIPEDHFENVPCIYGEDHPSIELFRKGTMHVHLCRCGFVYNKHQAKSHALSLFYRKSDAMKNWSEIKSSASEDIRQEEKFGQAVKYINESNIKYVLDLGCGTGKFLSMLDISWRDKVGVDEGSSSIDAAIKNGRPLHCAPIDSFLRGSSFKFHCVTLWGVLEHYKHPWELMNNIHEALAPGGKVIVCVPNPESMVVKRFWKECFTFCPQHLWYFNHNRLTHLFEETGFKVIDSYTIEAEAEPVQKGLMGLGPYQSIPDWLTEFKKEELEILKESILSSNQGYKIIFYGEKSVQHSNNPSESGIKVNQE